MLWTKLSSFHPFCPHPLEDAEMGAMERCFVTHQDHSRRGGMMA